MSQCMLEDLGCPNDEYKDMLCKYHYHERRYGSDVLQKVSSQWTEEEREVFHEKFGFYEKPM